MTNDRLIKDLGEALLSVLNVEQLLHFARVNTPSVSEDEGEYEMCKVRLALFHLRQNRPDLYDQAFAG